MDVHTTFVHAAGGVLWRVGSGSGIEVAAVYRPSAQNWSLPKGKLDADEHPLAAACREVAEETGIPPVPQTFLTSARYVLPHPDGDVTKTVDFWSMRTEAPDSAFVPSKEVADRRWIGLSTAMTVLTRPRDQQALLEFSAMPPITATILLVRHAQTDGARHGDRPAVTQPLDDAGHKQAAQAASLLRLFEPRRIVAAPPVRCVRTVAPLAELVGLDVVGESVFDADEHGRHIERAGARLREMAGQGSTFVVCADRATIADTLAILADTDGVRLADVHTPPAGAWVLSFSLQRLVAVTRL